MKKLYEFQTKQGLNWQKQRENHMNTGFELAKLNDPLHIKGCMLYWAEGSKNTSNFQFTNCDPTMHKILIKFIKKYFPHLKDRIKAYVNFYPDEINTYDKVKSFWCEELGITLEQFNKPTDRSKYYPKPKENKYPNGILRIQVCSFELLNHIYGAINNYTGKNLFSPILSNTC